MNKGRTKATAWVSGKHHASHLTISGKVSKGKNTPLKNIIGVKNKVK